ncbi:MAG: DUF4843 domain-containing protein [Bacteroidales bacterium]|nr:DUF4843 domain-containing protein [Bacteroidales bacterium]
MKNILKNIFVVCLALAAYSCQEKYDVYNLPDDKLGFTYGVDSYNGDPLPYSVHEFSFVYLGSDIVRDTVWVEMTTSGFVTDKDRPFMLEQVQISSDDKEFEDVENLTNAEAGKHYVAFDDAEVAHLMVVKAGENSVKVPVIVKRDDPYLEEGTVHLKMKLKENDNFVESFGTNKYYTISITNQLIMPVGWDIMEYYFAGEYGPAKLRFMIDAATWTINDEWFDENFGDYSLVDMGYTGYLSTYYTNKLIEYNQQRKAQGLDVLREEDGTIVQFVSYGMPQPYI